MSEIACPEVGNVSMGSGAEDAGVNCVVCDPLTSMSGSQWLLPGDAMQGFDFSGLVVRKPRKRSLGACGAAAFFCAKA